MDESKEQKMMENAREDLRDRVCGNCREYKGMVDGPEGRYCLFCE